MLIQKQINAESSKKDSDSSKIQEYKNQIAELAEEMASIINDMLEDIIGYSAEDIAKELGDAFFEAAAAGEDALEAWKDKANEIVRDVIKNMLVTKFLEEPLGQIFDKYRKKWFGEDGNFRGIDTVIDAMNEFSADINQVGAGFSEIWDALSDDVRELFTDDAEREGTSRGIATASQESVDENNARLTTIQGHTYSLVQGMGELNATSNQILARVTGIERNTDETNNKLDNMNSRIRRIESSVDEIQTKGITIKV